MMSPSVRIKYRLGEKSVMHSHPESVATYAFTHLPENTSKKPFEVIEVDLKG